jgi:signal peptidase I
MEIGSVETATIRGVERYPEAPARVLGPAQAMAAPARKPLWRTLLELLLVAGILIAAFNFFFTTAEVVDDSMSPLLRPGQRVLVSRIPFTLTSPARGDVVVVRSRIDPTRSSTFRVVGLPGDLLNIKGAQVTLNNQPLREPYLPEALERLGVTSLNVGQYRVPERNYFLMNDNRFDLNDSRSFGMARSDDIMGRAWLVFWPPENIAVVRHERPTSGAN